MRFWRGAGCAAAAARLQPEPDYLLPGCCGRANQILLAGVLFKGQAGPTGSPAGSREDSEVTRAPAAARCDPASQCRLRSVDVAAQKGRF